MVTTSEEMDLTLGDNIDIGNWIGILVVNWGDSTLLGPSSFEEQDMVELCVILGQEHPQGVLQLLDTEVVLAFQCSTNMMAMMHHLPAAKVCWGEPIVVCILPQRVGRWEDISMRSSHPYGAQIHVQGREMDIWPLPCMPSLDKGPSEAQATMPQVEFTKVVWTSMMINCRKY